MSDYYHYFHISQEARSVWLNSIIERLQLYDQCLDSFKFTKQYLKRLNEILNQPFDWQQSLDEKYFKGTVNLCNPKGLRDVLYEIDYNLGLDIKRWKNFPVFFLYRYKYDSFLQHYVILEEVYRSKNYPGSEQRFLRLRAQSSERNFLNSVPYRTTIQRLLRGKKKRSDFEKKINYSLNLVAEVLNLAWDEDFELTRRLCMHLKINHIVEAMELIHLILGTEDFSWLRERPTIVTDFFVKEYGHPHIGAFLNKVKELDHREWTSLVDQAKRDYIQLKVSISKLFKLDVSNGSHNLPLWKWVFLCHDKGFPPFEITDALREVIKDVEGAGEKVLEIHMTDQQVFMLFGRPDSGIC